MLKHLKGVCVLGSHHRRPILGNPSGPTAGKVRARVARAAEAHCFEPNPLQDASPGQPPFYPKAHMCKPSYIVICNL